MGSKVIILTESLLCARQYWVLGSRDGKNGFRSLYKQQKPNLNPTSVGAEEGMRWLSNELSCWDPSPAPLPLPLLHFLWMS